MKILVGSIAVIMYTKNSVRCIVNNFAKINSITVNSSIIHKNIERIILRILIYCKKIFYSYWWWITSNIECHGSSIGKSSVCILDLIGKTICSTEIRLGSIVYIRAIYIESSTICLCQDNRSKSRLRIARKIIIREYIEPIFV